MLNLKRLYGPHSKIIKINSGEKDTQSGLLHVIVDLQTIMLTRIIWSMQSIFTQTQKLYIFSIKKVSQWTMTHTLCRKCCSGSGEAGFETAKISIFLYHLCVCDVC